MKNQLRNIIFIIAPILLLFINTPVYADDEVPPEFIYYFMKSDAEGLSFLENWGKPDTDELIKLGFKQVTKHQIYDEGYLTPSESEEAAKEKGDIDEGNMDAYGYSSWINTRTEGNTKKIEAGSKTSRPWYAPGSLWICCTLYHCTPPSPRTVAGQHGPYSTRGWYTYYTFPREYPVIKQSGGNKKVGITGEIRTIRDGVG